jgi:hypothetical protein
MTSSPKRSRGSRWRRRADPTGETQRVEPRRKRWLGRQRCRLSLYSRRQRHPRGRSTEMSLALSSTTRELKRPSVASAEPMPWAPPCPASTLNWPMNASARRTPLAGVDRIAIDRIAVGGDEVSGEHERQTQRTRANRDRQRRVWPLIVGCAATVARGETAKIALSIVDATQSTSFASSQARPAGPSAGSAAALSSCSYPAAITRLPRKIAIQAAVQRVTRAPLLPERLVAPELVRSPSRRGSTLAARRRCSAADVTAARS